MVPKPPDSGGSVRKRHADKAASGVEGDGAQGTAAAPRARTMSFRALTANTDWAHLADNEHIFTGYRVPDGLLGALKSLFTVHNESCNVWSHLIGGLAMLYLLLHLLSGGLQRDIQMLQEAKHAVVDTAGAGMRTWSSFLDHEFGGVASVGAVAGLEAAASSFDSMLPPSTSAATIETSTAFEEQHSATLLQRVHDSMEHQARAAAEALQLAADSGMSAVAESLREFQLAAQAAAAAAQAEAEAAGLRGSADGTVSDSLVTAAAHRLHEAQVAVAQKAIQVRLRIADAADAAGAAGAGAGVTAAAERALRAASAANSAMRNLAKHALITNDGRSVRATDPVAMQRTAAEAAAAEAETQDAAWWDVRPRMSHLFGPGVPQWPIAVFIISAAICLLTSAAFHLLHVVDRKLFELLARADYAGIAILIFGSGVPLMYYAFYCMPVPLTIYLLGSGLSCGACVMLGMLDRFQSHEWRMKRASTFVAAGLFGVLPMTHVALSTMIYHAEVQAVIKGALLMGALYLVGASLYAWRIPESLAPGRFDFMPSHSIFHLCVFAACLVHYNTVLVEYRWRSSLPICEA